MSDNSTSNPPDLSSPRLKAALAVLGVLGFIGVGIIIWWTMRLKVKDKLPFGEVDTTGANTTGASLARNRNSERESIGGGIASVLRSGSTSLKRSLSSTLASTKTRSKSIAAKITPFNPNLPSALDSTKLHEGDGPRFVHTPGANMRIATRLSNGVWQFSEPVRGGLNSVNSLPNVSQASLLLNQRPSSPYLSPTSARPSPTTADPFSDSYASNAHLTSPISPISPIENPFRDDRMPRRQGTADSAQSTVHSTDTHVNKYPSSRPTRGRAGTLPPGSVYRGTIYDLERAERGPPLVPAGIHELEEDIMKKKGTPLPVIESELMRRGLRNSVGSTALLNAGSSGADSNAGVSGLIRKKSSDTLATFGKGLGRRPSEGSAVLLGGTGPVGVSRNRSRTMGIGPRTTTYHPDLDEVINISPTRERRVAVDVAHGAYQAGPEPAEDDDRDTVEGRPQEVGELDALSTPVSGGIRHGLSPYRVSEAFTSTIGHGSLSTAHGSSDNQERDNPSRSRSSHLPQPSVTSTFTTATSLYPHSVGTTNHPSTATVSGGGTIFLGSMASLGQFSTPRPSFSDGTRPEPEPPLPPLPSKYSQYQQPLSSADPDLLEPPVSPTTMYPYSPTSTTFTHSASATHTKKWDGYSYGGELGSEIHGYGFSEYNPDVGLGIDDFDAADESMYGHTFEDEDTTLTLTQQRVAREWERNGGEERNVERASVDIVDIPDLPPPEYMSPRKQKFTSASGKHRS